MPIKPDIIAEMLKGTGLLKADDIKDALRQQRDTRERLGLILLRKGSINDENIRNIVTTQIGADVQDTRDLKVDQDVLRRVPMTFAHHHRVVPIKFDNNILTIATDNPFNFLAFGNFKLFLGCDIEGILTTEADVDELLEKYYGLKEGAPIDALVAGMGTKKKVALREIGEEKEAPVSKEEETPVVKLVSLLIAEAFKKRASDIHIEPLENKFRIRYRIDGVLYEVPGPPKRLQPSVISRIKIMAGMDIAEKRLPQDGRIRIGIGGKELDLRVSTLPAIYGESVVLRILDKSSFLFGLKELGFMPEDEKKFERLIKMPNGIFLVTGPTGSGKTTTLASMTDYINSNCDAHIITVEDPIEYYHEHKKGIITQRELGVDVFSFSEAIIKGLRMNPDVILVGEMRDLATIEAAILAAETGHLVLATLHTISAAQTVDRIINVFPPQQQEQVRIQLSTSILAIYCQQLLTKAAKKGRVAAFEIMVTTPSIQNLIREKKTFRITSDIQTGAKYGMKTFDSSLVELYQRNLIDYQTMLSKAFEPDQIELRFQKGKR